MWTEVTRSDAMEMMLHHVVTIILISICCFINFSRIGLSILLLHDLADIFLEAAKMFNYVSKAAGRAWAKPVCDLVFGTFALVFFVTRLVVYPKYYVGGLLFSSLGIYALIYVKTCFEFNCTYPHINTSYHRDMHS